MYKIILASASPRRQQLLRQIGLQFKVIPSKVEEKIDNYNKLPEELVKQLAYSKALDVAKKIGTGYIVIGADTIVVYNNKILGKPIDEKQAYEMLNALNGNTHHVFTGISIIRTDDWKSITEYSKTLVEFRTLLKNEIQSYIDTKEPMDKAGAYGIQGMGCLLVERIEGDYFNVMGLPLAKLTLILKNEFGVNIL